MFSTGSRRCALLGVCHTWKTKKIKARALVIQTDAWPHALFFQTVGPMHAYVLSLTNSPMCILMSFPGSHVHTHCSRPTTQGTSFPPPWQAYLLTLTRSSALQADDGDTKCMHKLSSKCNFGTKFPTRHHIISIYLQLFQTSMPCGKNWQR